MQRRGHPGPSPWSDCDGDLERRYSKDELLTNVMIYWVTGMIESSFQPYHDVMSAGAMRWIMPTLESCDVITSTATVQQ